MSVVSQAVSKARSDTDVKMLCKHGCERPNGSSCRLRRLQAEWEKEVSAMNAINEASKGLHARKDRLYEKLTRKDTSSRKHKNFTTTSEMRFVVQDPWQPYRHNPGRSSRRTAFVADYGGNLYTGPERQSEELRNQNLITTTTTTTIAETASQGTPAATMRRKLPKHMKLKFNKAGKILAHKMPPAGMSSTLQPTTYAALSVRRKRWYSDYSGRKILIDSFDIPRVSSVA